jgi:hypothetical protein
MIRQPYLFAIGQTVLMVGAGLFVVALISQDFPNKGITETLVYGFLWGIAPTILGVVMVGSACEEKKDIV